MTDLKYFIEKKCLVIKRTKGHLTWTSKVRSEQNNSLTHTYYEIMNIFHDLFDKEIKEKNIVIKEHHSLRYWNSAGFDIIFKSESDEFYFLTKIL
jgi:hypothetical protein